MSCTLPAMAVAPPISTALTNTPEGGQVVGGGRRGEGKDGEGTGVNDVQVHDIITLSSKAICTRRSPWCPWCLSLKY